MVRVGNYMQRHLAGVGLGRLVGREYDVVIVGQNDNVGGAGGHGRSSMISLALGLRVCPPGMMAAQPASWNRSARPFPDGYRDHRDARPDLRAGRAPLPVAGRSTSRFCRLMLSICELIQVRRSQCRRSSAEPGSAV